MYLASWTRPDVVVRQHYLSGCGILNWFCSLGWSCKILKCFKPLLQLSYSLADSWLQNWPFCKPPMIVEYGLPLNIFRSGIKASLCVSLIPFRFCTTVLFSNTVETTLFSLCGVHHTRKDHFSSCCGRPPRRGGCTGLACRQGQSLRSKSWCLISFHAKLSSRAAGWFGHQNSQLA